jgi:hypothetical protein
MKQIVIVFLCIMMVMLIGYIVQNENLDFGPMTALANPFSPDLEYEDEEYLTDLPLEPALLPPPFAIFGGKDEPLQASAGSLHSGGR